jgi:hypothetical protein
MDNFSRLLQDCRAIPLSRRLLQSTMSRLIILAFLQFVSKGVRSGAGASRHREEARVLILNGTDSIFRRIWKSMALYVSLPGAQHASSCFLNRSIRSGFCRGIGARALALFSKKYGGVKIDVVVR